MDDGQECHLPASVSEERTAERLVVATEQKAVDNRLNHLGHHECRADRARHSAGSHAPSFRSLDHDSARLCKSLGDRSSMRLPIAQRSPNGSAIIPYGSPQNGSATFISPVAPAATARSNSASTSWTYR